MRASVKSLFGRVRAASILRSHFERIAKRTEFLKKVAFLGSINLAMLFTGGEARFFGGWANCVWL